MWRLKIQLQTRERYKSLQTNSPTTSDFGLPSMRCKRQMHYVRKMSQEKNEVWGAVVSAAAGRLAEAKHRFEQLQGALESESKSSAGDKHETGRAMVQQEMERAADAWKLAQETADQVTHRAPATGSPVRWGSWVVTDRGSFVIAVAMGAISRPQGRIHVISPASPLAQALLKGNVRPGDSVRVNGALHRVISVA